MRHTSRRLGFGLAAVFGLLALGGRASADVVDLTTAGSSGTINGALFQQVSPQSTGTGVIDPFVRLQNKGVEQGYNTDARPVQFDEKTAANFTRSLLLSSVPVVTINGTAYRQFLLDINETGSKTGPRLSLDQVQIFQANSGSLNNYPNLGKEVYNLDAGGNNSVLLNYDLNPGSGAGDMFAYIPDSLFDKSIPYVYLYSHFGSDIANASSDAGFEEWAVLQGTAPVNEVPAPATLIFACLASGLGMAEYTRRRVREKRATATS